MLLTTTPHIHASPNDALLRVRPVGSGGEEEIAIETPVALSLNGISQAVMLATPQDLEDFALGFALAEGWIADADQLLDTEVIKRTGGIELALRVKADHLHLHQLRRRTLSGRTGCGLCGLDSLAQLEVVQPGEIRQPWLTEDALTRAFDAFSSAQPLNARCGGLHAAAWCDAEGALKLAREDIGRHNALDKVTGALARSGQKGSAGFILMSSRASYELVHKAAMAGVGLLACMSAPSSLAIESARRFGLQLWAFVRHDRATRYA